MATDLIKDDAHARRIAEGMAKAIQTGQIDPGDERVAQARAALQAYAQSKKAQPQPFDQEAFDAGPVPTGNPQENLRSTMQGALGPALGAGAAASPATEALAGVGRTVSSVSRGLQQLASSPAEALALGKVEEQAREQWAEYDEGLGAEDVGETLAFFAPMLAPGGGAIQGANAASKAFSALKNLSGSLGGAAIWTGLIEGAKAATPEESQALNAAAAAGTTAVGGRMMQGAGGWLKNSVKDGMLGTVLTSIGLRSMADSTGRSTLSRGLFGAFNKMLFGRRGKGTEMEERLIAGKAGPEAKRLIAASAQAEAKEAERQYGLAAGDPVWDAWLDLVKGPKSPKTGRRLRGSGLEGTSTKAARESGIDITAERNRITGTLMGAVMRRNPETGEVVFDLPALDAAWRNLQSDENFRKIYGKTLTDGSFSPNKVARSVDDFISDMLTTGKAEGATTITGSQILKNGVSEIEVQVDKVLKEVEEIRQKAGTSRKARRDSEATRARAIALQQIMANDGLAEANALLEQGDAMGIFDYFDTVEEKAREILE